MKIKKANINLEFYDIIKTTFSSLLMNQEKQERKKDFLKKTLAKLSKISEFDINYQHNTFEQNALIYSIIQDIRFSSILLQHGADPNSTNKNGVNALTIVISMTNNTCYLESFLKAGANPNYINKNDQGTALMMACFCQTPSNIRCLIDYGASVSPEIRNKNGDNIYDIAKKDATTYNCLLNIIENHKLKKSTQNKEVKKIKYYNKFKKIINKENIWHTIFYTKDY